MLLRSVVTRLLIFPTKLSALEWPSLSVCLEALSSSFVDLLFDLPLLDALDLTLDELARKVSSREWSVLTSVVLASTTWLLIELSSCGDDDSLIEAWSGVKVAGVAGVLVGGAFGSVSALTRMRRECSNISWVIRHSARTSVRVLIMEWGAVIIVKTLTHTAI